MIRQRQLSSLVFQEGQTSLVDIPRDAVYHMLRLACFGGTISSTYGTGPTGPTFDSAFPFSLIRNMRVLRNGGDVIWQGSGAQFAKEHYFLNNSAPKARLYTLASNVETLLTAVTSRGLAIPANADGIMANLVEFVGASTASTTQTSCLFDFQAEMWFQMPNDKAAATLVDARKLASFQLEITWATLSTIIIPGTNNTANTCVATVQLLATDQDNVDLDEPFGTFKRSSNSYNSYSYGSSQNQVMLNRGNFYQGIILQTRALKTGSSVVLRPENSVVQTIENRINSNFQLRKEDFRQLQAKNNGDNGGRSQVYNIAEGLPQGWAFMEYTAAMESASELVATNVMDQFDLMLSINAIGSATNGATTGSTNPFIDVMSLEIIPGVSVSAKAPQGSFAGSIARTSAKPNYK